MQAAGAAPQSVASVVEDLNDYYERGAFPRPGSRIGQNPEHGPPSHLPPEHPWSPPPPTRRA